MKHSLLFATHNPNKVLEIKKFAPQEYEIKSLTEQGWTTAIEETGKTLEENAWIKADTLVKALNCNCFADDSGLEIDALDGKPGVYSARFAGTTATAEDNMEKVLRLLDGSTNRKSRFRTVIALYWEGSRYTFEGKVEGHLLEEKKGSGGFGYDPIFVPTGYDKTFAELSPTIKNQIGHRGKALREMTLFLNELL